MTLPPPAFPPPQGPPPPPARRVTVLLLKLLVTTAACIWILSLVDWEAFWQTVRSATHALLVVVVVMRFGGLTLSSYKWQRLLALHGATFPLRQLVRWYLVATFLNHFLPTSIGGDAYRVYRTLNNARGRACAVLAVLAERGTGLLALLVLGVVGGLVVRQRGPDPLVSGILVLSAGAVLLAAAAVWLAPRVPLRRIADRRTWGQKLGGIADLLDDFRQHPRQVTVVGALSFAFHVNKICATWLVLYALDARIDPLALTVAVVGVEAIGLLPISLGGLGVVDGSFIYLVSQFGVAPEPALAAMLLLRVLNLPLSLAGAHFYLAGDRPSRGRPAQSADHLPTHAAHVAQASRGP